MPGLEARVLEVFIDKPMPYTLSLYCKGGIHFAMFTKVDPLRGGHIFIPAPIPPILSEDPEYLAAFIKDLAGRGYILEIPLPDAPVN